MTDSKRQEKMAKLLQKDVAQILQFEMQVIAKGAMITVTKIRVSPDMHMARVYLSIFKDTDDKILTAIQNATKEVRHRLGVKIKNQVRHIPELFFYKDDSLDYFENIEKLLQK